MVATVGSMIVTAKFKAGNILSGIKSVKENIKKTGLETKSLKGELKRMTGSMIGLAAAAGVTGGVLLGMLVSAIMKSPILAGVLAKLEVAFMLFGNTIAKHVKPILEWVVKAVQWLHDKFRALPEPIQAAIVYFIIIGGVILSLLGILGLLSMALGLVKTGLIALKAPAVIAAIAGSTAALVAFAAVVGLIVGGFAILILLKAGVFDMISNLGVRFREASNGGAFLRDMIMAIIGWFGVLGIAAIDFFSGEWDFTRTKAATEQMKDVYSRLNQNTYGGTGFSDTSMVLPEKDATPPPAVGVQNNEFHFDMSNIHGDMSDPAIRAEWEKTTSDALAELNRRAAI